MRCPNCALDNLEGMNFCGCCETPLRHHCPQCGFENPAEFAFCGKCGTRLTGQMSGSTPQPAASPPQTPLSYTPRHLAEKILTSRSALEGERKQVTVLFADVSGFTPLSERLDPEEVHTLMDRCFHILLDGVHRFEGTVNQFTGDGIMALFGAPIAHEDHPRRAVQAALEMQAALGTYGQELYKQQGIDLKLRIGVNTGEVVVAAIGDNLRMDYTAQGLTTNLAARLEAMAPPGGVLLSEQTYRHVEGYFNCQDLGVTQVKGSSQPIHVYQATGVRTRRGFLDEAEGRNLTRLIGRDRELHFLQGLLERTKGGQGQVASIVGEPGMGKTRLVYELKQALASEDVACMAGGCLSYGRGIAYLPFIDLLKASCGIEEREAESAVMQRVRTALDKAGLPAEEFAPALLSLLAVQVDGAAMADEGTELQQRKLFVALQTLLLQESRRRPLILMLENLHWMDTTSEELLTFLVDSIRALPILLLTTYRPGYSPLWGDRSHHTRLILESLSEGECITLVEELLHTQAVGTDVHAFIFKQAEGNPFYVEELTKSLLEMRALEQDQHGYVLTPGALQGKVPDTIQNVIAARIDRLPEREKRLIQAAAVIGREFPLQLLQKIAEREYECIDSLQHLQALELIYDRGFFPERRYLFKHALTQDVAYHSLLTPRRQALHEATGCAIEELSSARREEHCELLAHHFTRSGNRAKAVHYLSLAGKKAARIFGHEQAIPFFQEALGRLDGLPDPEVQKRKVVEILFDLEVLYDLLARRDEQRNTLERLIHSAMALDDPALLSDAYIRQGELLSVVGSAEDALACVERALGLKKLIRDKQGEVKALRALGFIYWQRGQYEEALHIHREVRQVHRVLGDRDTEGMDLINLGELLRQLHRYQEALQCLGEALQLLTALGSLMEIGICHYNLGNVYRDLAAYETALQHYLKGDDTHIRIGKAFNHAARARFTSIATTYSKLGHHREALPYYRQALEVSRKTGDRPDVVATLRRLAVTHEILREFPEALVCYQEALQVSRDLGDKQEERTILATMAHLYRQQLRDFHAALPCYQQSLALGEETGEDAGRLALLKGLGATCWNLGRYEEAAVAFEQALQITEAAGDQAEQAAVRSSLGIVLGNLRRYATALAHLREGFAIAKAMADLRAQGYILNALGNVYYEIGDQPMAKDCYQQAVELRRLIRDRAGEGWSCYYLGRAYREAEELGAAQEYQEQALSLATETGDAELQARAKIALAALHCRLDDSEAANRALGYAQEAVELARGHGLHQEESTGLSHQAIAFLFLRNVEEALRCSIEAVQQVEKGDKVTGEQEMIWLNHARILRACGQREPADHYLERASAGVTAQLATVRDARVRESMLQTRLLREILAERTTGGQHNAALSD